MWCVMLLPNMFMNVMLFSQELVIFNAVQVVEDFEPVENLTQRTILCTVQKADAERLQINNVDESLNYIEVHADVDSDLKINDQCIYAGVRYKLIFKYPDQDYGYVRVIFEQMLFSPQHGNYFDRDGENYIDRDGGVYRPRVGEGDDS